MYSRVLIMDSNSIISSDMFSRSHKKLEYVKIMSRAVVEGINDSTCAINVLAPKTKNQNDAKK